MGEAADELIQSLFRRWSVLEDEKANLAEDLKELFKEAKGVGLDVKALREAFRDERAAAERGPEDEEHEAFVSLYRAALHSGTPVATQARDAREQPTKTRPAVAPSAERAPEIRETEAPPIAPAEAATEAPVGTAETNTAPGYAPCVPRPADRANTAAHGEAQSLPAGDSGRHETGDALPAGPDNREGETALFTPPSRPVLTDDDLDDDPWLRSRFGAPAEARP